MDISRTADIKIAFVDIIKTWSLFLAILGNEFYLIIILPFFTFFYIFFKKKVIFIFHN